jgi:hypothetical protein
LVAVFAGVTLPWSVFLVGAARARADPQAGGASKQVRALMWIWLLATLVFFSIPRSKLIGYVMVALPPFAALVAEGLVQAAGTQARARIWTMRVAVLAVAIGAAALIVANSQERARDNTGQLAALLSPLTSPADPLVVLYNYPFSLPFYLKRAPPLLIVEAWQDGRVMEKDTWRRELHEAAAFDPGRGKAVLLEPGGLQAFLSCATRPVWLIVASASADRLPQIPGLERVAEVGRDSVWRKTPSDSRSDCTP